LDEARNYAEVDLELLLLTGAEVVPNQTPSSSTGGAICVIHTTADIRAERTKSLVAAPPLDELRASAAHLADCSIRDGAATSPGVA
jgi:hypothetical protein